MSDDIWQRDEIESPCQKICLVHEASGLCIGCLRTRAEIAGWSHMTSPERQAIMADLPARTKKLRGKRRGGRAGRV
ncbi:MAG: DUF1289 domain-containing protein [Alphaproteobacteria bacterium]|nr:DUF1289 domain-containing protein [Alphaproteobacteria bacterium]